MNAFGATTQQATGAFRAEDVTMTLGGKNAKGMIVQSFQFTCQRTVNFLYEIGSSNVYYVGNRRQGQAQAARVVGGVGDFKDLITNYSDICDPKNITISAAGSGGGRICKAGNMKYDLVDAILVSVGINVTAQEIVINEQVGFMFSDLEI